MTTLMFGTAYALVLMGIAYLLMERLLERLQAQPITVVIAGPVEVKGNGDLSRQALREISSNLFSGFSLLAEVWQSGKVSK